MTVTNFAQKFTTIGVSGGVRIQVIQDNPGVSVCTTPAVLNLSLYLWDTDYTTTVATTVLVRERAVVPSQEIEDALMWIFMFWKPLNAGIYMWLIYSEIVNNHGAFQLRLDTTSTYNDAFEDGVGQSYDFLSEILGLDAATHEKVLSLGDTFDGAYNTNDGHSGTKINKGSVGTPNYVNSIRAQDAVVKSGQKAGRIASGSLVKTG